MWSSVIDLIDLSPSRKERKMNSTEYIEKNFALEKAENQNYLGVLYHVESDTIIKFIKSLPTVDAVPVIRCKNCAFSEKETDMDRKCGMLNRWFPKTFYCALAVRKEE